ncbi:hypothetical protein LZ32DRAFT_688558 [Colletotrichum eremochloae]|nr:hypothetical protein LZ32DRAFT_688558 [Colletotrichum eremochloae]
MGRIKELPAWYHRVRELIFRHNPDYPYGHDDSKILPHFFDEDLSDLESDTVSWCDCDSEDEDCPHQTEDDEDMSSNAGSIESTIAEEYDNMNDLREKRKRQLKRLRELEEIKQFDAEEKQREKEKRSRIMEEFRAAYDALRTAEKESETLYLGSLAGKYFRLLPADYDGRLHPDLKSNHIQFYHPHDDGESSRQRVSRNDRRTVQGDVQLHTWRAYDLRPFRLPTRPSRRKHVLEISNSLNTYKLDVKFISDSYLTVKVSRDAVHGDHQGRGPELAPEIMEFAHMPGPPASNDGSGAEYYDTSGWSFVLAELDSNSIAPGKPYSFTHMKSLEDKPTNIKRVTVPIVFDIIFNLRNAHLDALHHVPDNTHEV